MDYPSLDEYEGRDFDALKIAARRVGVPLNTDELNERAIRSADWKTLHNIRSAAKRVAQKLLTEMKDTTDELDHRAIERNHNLTLAAYDAVQEEIDLRDAHGTREPLSAVERNPNIPALLGGGECRAWGDGSEHGDGAACEWRDRRGNPVRVLKPDQKIETVEQRGLGVGDIAKAMIFGPSNDAERRALSEGTDSAGGYTVPTRLASYFIDKLRAKSVVFQAGAQTVPMDSDNLAIARLTGDPTVAWTAENAEISASDPTFDAVTLAPKKLAALVKVSRELLEDSVNIGAALEAAFVGAMSIEADRALLFGSGSSNQPTGLFNISGINSVSMGTNGAVPTSYDNLIDLIYEVQVDNGADPKVLIMHPRTNATYAKLKDSQNNPLNEPSMTAALRRLLTTGVPIDQDQGTATGVCSTILTGDFSKMLVGVRTTMELRMLNERYAEFDQVGFLARMRMDVAVENPVHFAKLIGIKAS